VPGTRVRAPLAVVDLHLFARHEGQAVELLGLAVAQLVGEALDGVVGADVAVQIHQVLVNGHGVATQPKLGLDEGAVGFAGRCRWRNSGRRHCRRHGRSRCRWPGWGNLLRRAGGHPQGAGGHPGGICRSGSGEPLLVTADRLAIDPREALDVTLAGAGLQQGPDGCL